MKMVKSESLHGSKQTPPLQLAKSRANCEV
jgi:hypothetical protein